jgi:flagellar hook-basal body complex protein FliE
MKPVQATPAALSAVNLERAPTLEASVAGATEAAPNLESAASAAAGALEGPSFGDIFGRMVAEAAERSNAAGAQAEALASGASDDVHGTMIALKEAEISTKLVGQIRSKLLDAFQELWRTSV